MLRLMWDDKLNAFVDYDWRNQQRSERLTAATAYPLFVDLATTPQAQRVAGTIRASLLHAARPRDHPRRHRPAVGRAERLGAAAMDRDRWPATTWRGRTGRDIAARWVAENARVYCGTGKLVEKYNVREAGAGAGGEYPVQDGFGWTNAVLVKLLAMYPRAGDASDTNSPARVRR